MSGVSVARLCGRSVGRASRLLLLLASCDPSAPTASVGSPAKRSCDQLVVPSCRDIPAFLLVAF